MIAASEYVFDEDVRKEYRYVITEAHCNLCGKHYITSIQYLEKNATLKNSQRYSMMDYALRDFLNRKETDELTRYKKIWLYGSK